MRRIALSTGIVLSMFILMSLVSTEQGGLNWLLNFDTAKETAQSENKVIMMSFQGSDWCGACKRLDRALFQSEVFMTYAGEKLVVLKVDFPMKKANKLSDEQTAHNEALAEKYNKEGKFPRVLFFNASGEQIGELKQPQEDVESYMKSIKAMIE